MSGAPLRLARRREEIAERVAALGREIAERYAGEDLVLVGILKGATVFLADLVRATPLPLRLDFLALRPIDPAARHGGPPALTKDLELDVSGKAVLVVEDVVDSGVTLAQVLRLLAARDPASLRVCTLLDRPAGRVATLPVDHVGFTVAGGILVGYGLDLHGRFRHCPDLWEVVDEPLLRADPDAALRLVTGAS